MIDPSQVAGRLEVVRNRISDAGGDDSITVVAVTKGFGPDAITAAHEVGLADVGESYAQEMIDKRAAVPPSLHDELRWHFIGQLQSNKVRQLVGHVDVWQSVDRLKLGTEIVRRAEGVDRPEPVAADGPKQQVLVQVNPGGAEHKAGCRVAEVPDLVAALRVAGVDVIGLMSVGIIDDETSTRAAFEDITRLADRLELPVRSMGMSADIELAVAAGTTMVRVGSDLFGPRPIRR